MELFRKKYAAFFISLFLSCLIPVFSDTSYIVKKGDTLYSISKKYQLTVAELRTANNLTENDVLKAGQKLVIPVADISNAAALSSSSSKDKSSYADKDTKLYEVQKGDTLYGIARKFSIKLPELLALNNIDTNATLKAGQKIKVPVDGNTVKSPSQNTVYTDPKGKNDVGKIDTVTVWPLASPFVKNINGKVSGVELTGKSNEPVKAVHSGTVMYTGLYRGFGEVVFIQSKTGLIYSYSGLGSVKVTKGAYVTAGDEIGKTGKGTESSIKFMVFQNGMPVNPAKAPRG